MHDDSIEAIPQVLQAWENYMQLFGFGRVATMGHTPHRPLEVPTARSLENGVNFQALHSKRSRLTLSLEQFTSPERSISKTSRWYAEVHDGTR